MARSISVRKNAHGPLTSSQDLRTQLHQSPIFDELMDVNGPRVLAVCGCHDRAGTTSIALGLAVMMSERSSDPVLYLEANMRSPAIRDSYNISDTPGLEELVTQEAKLDECLVELPGTGIYAIAARISQTPLRYLNPLKSQLPQISRHYRYTLIDCPPVIPYPEIGILGPVTDGVLLVLEAEETRWQVAKEAKKRIESAGAKLLGVVLNKKPHHIPNWLYRLL